jgi:hypothetical protein
MWYGQRGLLTGALKPMAYIDFDAPHVLPTPRWAGLSTLSLELPLPMRPFNHLGYLAIVGTLTQRIRQLVGVPWGPQHAATDIADHNNPTTLASKLRKALPV